MAFSATDAALEGFRITRAHPKAILAWAGVQLALIALMNAAMLGLAGDQIEKFASFSYLTASDGPAELNALLPVMSQILAIDLLLMVVFNAVLYAAINRAVLGRETAAPGWLRLGPDELRQGLVLLAYALVLVLAYFVGAMAVQLFALLLSALLGAAGLLLGRGLGVLADFALVIWVGVRLSLAPAATFANGRFTLFQTWPLTRGRFWPLLGAYALSWLLYLLVSVLVLTVAAAVLGVLPGGLHAESKAQLHSLAAFADPGFLVGLVFSALGGGLTTAVILAPAPYAYHALAAPGRQADAFA